MRPGRRQALHGLRGRERSSAGDCYDKAMRESFLATRECEIIERQRFRTRAEARMALFDFIERWYDPRRRHSAIG